jgi:hypothetical protein
VYQHESDGFLLALGFVVADVRGFLLGLVGFEERVAVLVLPDVVVEAPVVAVVQFGVVFDPVAELLEGQAGWS